MPEWNVDVSKLPSNTRASFEELANLLRRLAGESLLGISAFGGWLHEDPLFATSPARSVVVLDSIDLKAIAQLATEGKRFGQRGLAAPLMMTPAYIAASRDVFPLELLEIQQVHAVIAGADHFADLQFDRAHVRLQCERELKSELIRLRQGLLAAAGDPQPLQPLCHDAAERGVRILRGILHLVGRTVPPLSTEITRQAADVTSVKLAALQEIVAGPQRVDIGLFERCYGDFDALSTYVDGLAS